MRKLPKIQDCVPIGKVSRSHGNSGELYITIYPKIEIDFSDVEFVFFEINSKLVPFRILEVNQKKNTAYVSLISIDSEKKAERYIGFKIFVENQHILADKSQHELLGFKVYDADKTLLGTIKDVVEYPMHSVLEVESETKKELQIPFNEHFVVSFNAEEKEIVFDLPEGILDL